MNLDIEIPNRNFHELCNVIKWKEAPHTYNKEELQAKSIADALYNNMTLDPDDVLKRSHSCAHGKEETFNYLLLGKSDEELQNDVSQIYHCHSCYIFLPGEYYILSNRLLREGNYLQWLTLLQNLKHLFLQSALILELKAEQHFLAILHNLEKYHFEYPKTMAALIREYWFEWSQQVSVNLHSYTLNEDNDYYKSFLQIQRQGELKYNNWKTHLKVHVKVIFEKLRICFTKQELTRWSATLKQRDGRQDVHSEAYNKLTKLIKDYIINKYNAAYLDIDTGDFDYLILVIDILLNDEEPNVSKLESAIKTIINNIKNNTYKWYPTLDSNSIANLNTMINAITHMGDSGKLLLEKESKLCHIVYEGWNATPENDLYDKLQSECFIFCCQLLLISASEAFNDEIEREVFWKKVTDSLFRQIHVCDNKYFIERYYKHVLILAALIINQKYKKGEMEFLNKIKMEIIDENIQKEIISQVLHKK